jgi:hypothetical protein
MCTWLYCIFVVIALADRILMQHTPLAKCVLDYTVCFFLIAMAERILMQHTSRSKCVLDYTVFVISKADLILMQHSPTAKCRLDYVDFLLYSSYGRPHTNAAQSNRKMRTWLYCFFIAMADRILMQHTPMETCGPDFTLRKQSSLDPSHLLNLRSEKSVDMLAVPRLGSSLQLHPVVS